MTTTTPTRFRTSLEAPSIEYQGVRFELTIKGTNIDGDIRLDKANIKGRRGCHVTVSRRNHWTDAELAAALRVAGHWLRDIGGINLLRTAALGHVIARLKQGQSIEGTERLMHWAIGAYAHAKWHRENKAWTTLGRFFTGEHFDKWLNESTAYQSYMDRQESEANERHEAELREKREYAEAATRERERRDGRYKPAEPVRSPLRDVPDAELQCMLDAVSKHAIAVSDIQYRKVRRMVSDLDPRTRAIMLRIVKFENQNSWLDAPGSKGDMGPMTLDNRHYYCRVWGRLVFLMARHRGIQSATLREEIEHENPERPHKHSEWEIKWEIGRRCDTAGTTGHGDDLVSGARRRLGLPGITSKQQIPA